MRDVFNARRQNEDNLFASHDLYWQFNDSDSNNSVNCNVWDISFEFSICVSNIKN